MTLFSDLTPGQREAFHFDFCCFLSPCCFLNHWRLHLTESHCIHFASLLWVNDISQNRSARTIPKSFLWCTKPPNFIIYHLYCLEMQVSLNASNSNLTTGRTCLPQYSQAKWKLLFGFYIFRSRENLWLAVNSILYFQIIKSKMWLC